MNFHFNKNNLNKIEEEKSKINFNKMSNNRETNESLKRKLDELISENEKLKNEIEIHKKQLTNDLKPRFNYIFPSNFNKENCKQTEKNQTNESNQNEKNQINESNQNEKNQTNESNQNEKNQTENNKTNENQVKKNRLLIRIRRHISCVEEDKKDGKNGNDDENGNDGENGNDSEKKNNKKRKNETKKEEKKEDTPLEDDFDPFLNDHHGMAPILVTLIGLKRQNGDNGDNDDDNQNVKKKKEESFFDYFKNAKELHPIEKEIKTLQDFIDLGKSYDEKDEKRYVINLRALNKCVPVLEELNNMIGMKNVKKMILDLLFYRLQNLENEDEEEEKKPQIKRQRIDTLGIPPFALLKTS